MHKIYNFSEDKAINLPLTENRAFLYGDGFFETLIIKDSEFLFLEDHYTRMLKASKQLQIMPFPTIDSVKKVLLEMIGISTNSLLRLKIIIFRDSEGLFSPEKNTPLFFIDIKKIEKHIISRKSAFFCTNISNRESITSRFKTISSLNYVLAGIELKNSNFQEIILLDDHSNISECLSSNIWWIKNNTVYLPSLSTGCIEGVSQINICRYLKSKNIQLMMGEFSKENLLDADFCFTSNVAGLNIINSIEKTLFQEFHFIFEDIKKALF